MADMVQGTPRELASYLPRYVDFRCSEDGTMWLRPMDLDAGGLSGGPMWLRIEPDGAARDVRLPDRFDALRFTPSRIWGVSPGRVRSPVRGVHPAPDALTAPPGRSRGNVRSRPRARNALA